MQEKRTFVFYNDRTDYLDEMSFEEKGIFLQTILDYQNWKEVKPTWSMKFIRSRIKKQMDEDNKKREEEKERRIKNWKMGALKRRWNGNTIVDDSSTIVDDSSEKQCIDVMAVCVNGCVNDSVNDFVNTNVSENKKNNLTKLNKISDEILVQEKKEYWNLEINELIKTLKKEAEKLWIAYDSNDERIFAKHILTAKEFWKLADRYGISRVQFAVWIMNASVQINYRKGACSWPKKIYQNTAEVFNEAIRQKQKEEKNKIASF